MRVLSLFDGISCGRVALGRAGIKVDKYYASEIDKYAIQIAKKNYPDTIHIGDVTKTQGCNFKDIDLLIGGSPCQGFSFAGKQLNFEDERSKLFFEYVRLLKEINPKYFLLENVKMKKEYQDVISKYIDVEPIEINSALVSEQNRVRLYWTNIPNIQQPKDLHIPIQLNKGEFPAYMDNKRNIRKTEKFSCLTATYWKGIRGAGRPFASKKLGHYDDVREFQRMLTPEECERLQTLPIGYTAGICKTQRYKCLGNGWTVDVIAHILKHTNL